MVWELESICLGNQVAGGEGAVVDSSQVSDEEENETKDDNSDQIWQDKVVERALESENGKLAATSLTSR